MPDDRSAAGAPLRPDQFVLWLAGATASCDRLPTLTQWRRMLTMLHAVCPAAPAPEPLPAPTGETAP